MQKLACPPAQFELLPTNQDLIKKSEVAPNPKIGLFSNEGQLQIIFRRIMHRGQKLELHPWRSRFLSWLPLGETGSVPTSV